MQKHTSADKSSNQVSALFKRQWARRIMTGKRVLDYGGGKYDAKRMAALPARSGISADA